MLTDVTIEGLRGVGKVELKFAPDQRVYTLFGENGIGKTKCLEALYQYLLASNKGFWNFAKPTRGLNSEILVMDRMTGAPHPVSLKRIEEKQDIGKVWEAEDSAPWHDSPVVFLGAGQRANFGNVSAVSALGKFAERRQKYFGALLSVLRQHDLRSLGMAGDTRAWFVARARSDNPYEKSRDNRKAEIDAVLSMLHDIDSRIDPTGFQIDADDHVFLIIKTDEYELGELSSGFAALVKTMQAIIEGYAAFTNEVQLRNVRGIVLIDEIDAHLHAEWQVRIIPCLKKLLPNTTFFVTTHSPLVLVRLLQKEAYLLKRDDDGVVRSQKIAYPNRRLFSDVLDDVLGVNLNKLKRVSMEDDDQKEAKQGLLALLDQLEAQERVEP
ncbi:MAG: ATP-binding protein [Candidatus Accumulibacter sp.]|jgi:predicted ATPase|nr:ATP-binding protein [Accumulibacter sp.]